MFNEIKVYKCYDENNVADYTCELWGASTKHPDSKYYFSDWDNKCPYFDDEVQIFQWLLWIASRTMFPFHAKELTEYALENWYNW